MTSTLRLRAPVRTTAGIASLTFVRSLATAVACAEDQRLSSHPGGTEPVTVNAGFQLTDVNGMVEEAEAFEFEGVLRLMWRDERLAFDPREVGADEKIYKGGFQFSKVFDGWWPQDVLPNESGNMDRQGVRLRVKPDGVRASAEHYPQADH